jgi:hypothetical protein
MRLATCAVVLAAIAGALAYGDEPKKAQSGASEGTAAVRAKKNSARMTTADAASPADATSAGSGEVIATNFTIQSGTCVRADSAIDYVSSSSVSITLLANNGTDMSATRIIPFFAVGDGSFYVSSGTIISAGNFYYFDGGGATVPVQGRFLRIRICNDANYDTSYAQLTARGSGTAN